MLPGSPTPPGLESNKKRPRAVQWTRLTFPGIMFLVEETAKAEQVLAVWERVAGRVLSGGLREQFLARPEVSVIGSYPMDVVEGAAQRVFAKTRELRLAAWREAALFSGPHEPTVAAAKQQERETPARPPKPTAAGRVRAPAVSRRDLEGPGTRAAPLNKETHRKISQMLGEIPPYN
jgi:hypothetical protein